jgi:hypothetical protein
MDLTDSQRRHLGEICNRFNRKREPYRPNEAHATTLRNLVEGGLVEINEQAQTVTPTRHGQYTIAQYRH